MKDRLTKSTKNRVLCGVCGGIAEYFDVDPVIVRIGAAVFGVFLPPTILVYLISAIIMPKE